MIVDSYVRLITVKQRDGGFMVNQCACKKPKQCSCEAKVKTAFVQFRTSTFDEEGKRKDGTISIPKAFQLLDPNGEYVKGGSVPDSIARLSGAMHKYSKEHPGKLESIRLPDVDNEKIEKLNPNWGLVVAAVPSTPTSVVGASSSTPSSPGSSSSASGASSSSASPPPTNPEMAINDDDVKNITDDEVMDALNHLQTECDDDSLLSLISALLPDVLLACHNGEGEERRQIRAEESGTDPNAGVPLEEVPYAAGNIAIPPGGENPTSNVDQMLQVSESLMQPGGQLALEEAVTGGDGGEEDKEELPALAPVPAAGGAPLACQEAEEELPPHGTPQGPPTKVAKTTPLAAPATAPLPQASPPASSAHHAPPSALVPSEESASHALRSLTSGLTQEDAYDALTKFISLAKKEQIKIRAAWLQSNDNEDQTNNSNSNAQWRSLGATPSDDEEQPTTHRSLGTTPSEEEAAPAYRCLGAFRSLSANSPVPNPTVARSRAALRRKLAALTVLTAGLEKLRVVCMYAG